MIWWKRDGSGGGLLGEGTVLDQVQQVEQELRTELRLRIHAISVQMCEAPAQLWQEEVRTHLSNDGGGNKPPDHMRVS